MGPGLVGVRVAWGLGLVGDEGRMRPTAGEHEDHMGPGLVGMRVAWAPGLVGDEGRMGPTAGGFYHS